ncbi:unnamed protein product, partial [Mesorhabditis spiculigera]
MKPPADAAPPKRVVKRKRKMPTDADKYAAEEREIKQRLKERAGSSRQKKMADGETANAVLKVGTSGKVSVENAESHNRVVSHAKTRHVARQYQLEIRKDSVNSKFKCAACGKGACEGELGDLFGPYYIEIQSLNQWPIFLAKKPHKAWTTPQMIDAWLHGDCALRLPDVFLKGGELLNLATALNKAWSQKCDACHVTGASVTTPHGTFHYPCNENV